MADGDPKAFAVDVQVQRDGDIEFHLVHVAGCEVAKGLSDQNLLPLGEHNSWQSALEKADRLGYSPRACPPCSANGGIPPSLEGHK
jgi:hypothetical protein